MELSNIFSGNKWNVCQLWMALAGKEFDRVREMLHSDEEDISLLKHIAKNMCDSKYRQENQIDKNVACEIYFICRELLDYCFCQDLEFDYDFPEE